MTLFHADDETEVRLFEPHHAAEAFAVIDRSREHVRPWLPWAAHNKDVDEVRQFIQGALEEFARGEQIACGIWRRGELVGGIGSHLDAKNRTASVGYWISPASAGQGIVTRAAHGMVRYLFEEREMDRVEIRCQKENVRSRAIPERLGFAQEGTLRGAFRLYEQAVDVVVYALLRSEWTRSEWMAASAGAVRIK